MFLGRMILSPVLQVAKIAAMMPEVEPLIKNQVLLAPKVSADNSCAWAIAPSGVNKLSSSGNSGKSA